MRLENYCSRGSYYELTLLDLLTSTKLICFIEKESEPTLLVGKVYRIKGIETLRMGTEDIVIIDRMM